MKVLRYSALLLALASIFEATSATAIPLFAHKYHTTCFTCHTTPPVLNDFGRRFQANGYQIPGTNERIALWDQPMFAFGAVAQPMMSRTSVWDNIANASASPTTLEFTGIEVGLFSSGSLGAHTSYFAAVPVAIADGNTSIEIETANLNYTDILNDGTGSLNFRLGKFRFFMPFNENVQLSNPDIDPAFLVNGYNPFDGKGSLTTANDLVVSDPTFGLSAYGMIPGIAEGLRWEAGITGGNNSDIDLNTAKAFFFALDQTLFVDEAPLRFGGFYYTGSQDITDALGTDTLGNVLSTTWTNHPSRYGGSLEIYDPWSKRFDLFGEYEMGKDDNVDTVGAGYNMNGGFIGLNVILMPQKLYLYGRRDFRTVRSDYANPYGDNMHQWDVGLQYHLLPNVFLTGCYSITNEINIPGDGVSPVTDITTTNIGAGVRFGF